MVGLIIGVVVLVVIVGAPTALAIGPIAMPGCPDRCGDVSIPYPFGVSPSCYHDEDFFINCTDTHEAFLRLSSSNAPEALAIGPIGVSNILLDEGELEAMQYIAYDCYDTSGRNTGIFETNITFPKFWISTKNKFTAIGCDTTAVMVGSQLGQVSPAYGSGCVSLCNGPKYITNGSCSGIGCCQTSIPTRVRSFQMLLGSSINHTNITDFNPCSYAFVVQEGKFNFSLSSFTDLQPRQKMPLVLDWAIGNLTCDQAKQASNYACTDPQSECVLEIGSKYWCLTNI